MNKNLSITSPSILLSLIFILLIIIIFLFNTNKEDIFSDSIKNASEYTFTYLTDKDHKISLESFHYTNYRSKIIKNRKLRLNELKKIRSEMYNEYHGHEFNNVYNNRNEVNQLKYARTLYRGYINDILIEFYVNIDDQVSIVKLSDGQYHEEYYYLNNELFFHRYYKQTEEGSFMSDNTTTRIDWRISWIINDEIVERKDEFVLFIPENIEREDWYSSIFLDSENLLEKGNYYLQLYAYLSSNDRFYCRNSYAEFELGRIGFTQWIEKNINHTSLKDLSNYVRAENYDFKFETLYEFEINEKGELAYIDKTRKEQNYNDTLKSKFADQIDNEIIKVLESFNTSDYKWDPATHNCENIKNRKYLIVKSFPRINWLSNTPLHIILKNKVDQNSPIVYY